VAVHLGWELKRGISNTVKPSGRHSEASTGWVCITPCSVQIKRLSAFALDFEKQGYKPVRVMVRPEVGEIYQSSRIYHVQIRDTKCGVTGDFVLVPNGTRLG